MIDTTTNTAEPVMLPSGKRVSPARSMAMHSIIAAFMFLSPLRVFVPAAFMNAGLRHGRKGLWGAILGTTAIFAGLVAISASPERFSGQAAEIARLLFEIGIPAAVATMMMRRSAPLGNVLLMAVLVSVVGFFATEFSLRAILQYSPYEATVTNFRVHSKATVDLYRSAGMPEEGLRLMGRIADSVAATFMPSLMITLSALMFILSLIMIPRLPAGKATGTTYLFRNLSYPDTLLFGFIAGGLAPLVQGPLRSAAFNILAIVSFLYVLQGLAVFRSTLLRMGMRWFGNLVAYGTLVLLTFNGVAPFLLFLAGLFDSFFDFRNLKRKEDSDESDLD